MNNDNNPLDDDGHGTHILANSLPALLVRNPQLKFFAEHLATDAAFRSLFLLDPAGASAAAGLKLKTGAAEKIQALGIRPDAPLSVLIALLLPVVQRSPINWGDGEAPTVQHWVLLILPYLEQSAYISRDGGFRG